MFSITSLKKFQGGFKYVSMKFWVAILVLHGSHRSYPSRMKVSMEIELGCCGLCHLKNMLCVLNHFETYIWTEILEKQNTTLCLPFIIYVFHLLSIFSLLINRNFPYSKIKKKWLTVLVQVLFKALWNLKVQNKNIVQINFYPFFLQCFRITIQCFRITVPKIQLIQKELF